MYYDLMDDGPLFYFTPDVTEFLAHHYSRVGTSYPTVDVLLDWLNECWATCLLMMLHG